MAEAGKKRAGLGLPGGDAAQWPLQRYGRFVLLGAGEPPGPGLEAGMASSPTWKVFDSNEESGYLILTIVISGHFFISQGQTLLARRTHLFGSVFTYVNGDPNLCHRKPYWINLPSSKASEIKEEGFSLIGSKKWLKIVRRMDCLLFGTTIKDKSRMFRVQFSGESKQQALEHCDSCVQSLAQYVTIQTPEGSSQEPRLCRGPLPAAGSRGEGCVRSVPLLLPGSHQEPEQQRCSPAVTGTPGGRTSVTQLAQSLLASEELPLVYEQSAWNAEELGPFLRLCLMDQSFPAFVEQVERELRRLTGLRN